MNKTQLDKFITAANAAKVKEYIIRCENANRMISHNGDTRIIIEVDDGVLALETAANYAKDKGPFDLKFVPVEDLETIFVNNIDVSQALSIIGAYHPVSDEVKTMLSKYGARVGIRPGTDGLAVRVDSNGNAILDTTIAASVTNGNAPTVTDSTVYN